MVPFLHLPPKGLALFFMKTANKQPPLKSKLNILQMRVFKTTLTIRSCSSFVCLDVHQFSNTSTVRIARS